MGVEQFEVNFWAIFSKKGKVTAKKDPSNQLTIEQRKAYG